MWVCCSRKWLKKWKLRFLNVPNIVKLKEKEGGRRPLSVPWPKTVPRFHQLDLCFLILWTVVSPVEFGYLCFIIQQTVLCPMEFGLEVCVLLS